MGEFSFVLAGIGLGYGLIDEAERDLVIAVIALGFVVSPLWFGIAQWLRSKHRDAGDCSGKLRQPNPLRASTLMTFGGASADGEAKTLIWRAARGTPRK
jgi:monovalent cation:H+ antiporter-2, CPA2 family